MEIRDVYDINKTTTGETYKKGEMIPVGKYMLTVITFIENLRGEFLLQYTSESKGREWSSTGGHPKTGESSLEGIHTEVLEEIGIDIPKEEFQLVKSMLGKHSFLDIYYVKKDIDINDILLQQSEVESVKWASREEIEEMINVGVFKKTHKMEYEECLKWLDGKEKI